jgi:uncharacterized protein YjiS (DUF1127 family)
MVALINDILTNSQLARRQARRAALYDLGAGVVRTLAIWRRRAREKRELARLDWRELQDIGLTSADVQHLLDKPVWRD